MDWAELSRESLHALFDVDVAGHFLLTRAFARQALENNCTATILVRRLHLRFRRRTHLHLPRGDDAHAPAVLRRQGGSSWAWRRIWLAAWAAGESPSTASSREESRVASQTSFVRNFSALTQLGRMAKTSEVAAVAEMLCQRRSAYVTGQVIHVDGGWSAW